MALFFQEKQIFNERLPGQRKIAFVEYNVWLGSGNILSF